jgi:hypothetical protein
MEMPDPVVQALCERFGHDRLSLRAVMEIYWTGCALASNPEQLGKVKLGQWRSECESVNPHGGIIITLLLAEFPEFFKRVGENIFFTTLKPSKGLR